MTALPLTEIERLLAARFRGHDPSCLALLQPNDAGSYVSRPCSCGHGAAQAGLTALLALARRAEGDRAALAELFAAHDHWNATCALPASLHGRHELRAAAARRHKAAEDACRACLSPTGGDRGERG